LRDLPLVYVEGREGALLQQAAGTSTLRVPLKHSERRSVAVGATNNCQPDFFTFSVRNLAVQTTESGAATTMAADDALLCLQVCREL
jgi:hypothetical protein